MPPYERPGSGTPYGRRGPGDPRQERRGGTGERGIPDSLLIGVLGFLLGLTALTWSATGLAGWLEHGAWPQHMSFPRTPLAMRALVTDPHDIPAAWPGTPPGQLSGYGMFWGVFIGQLMVLIVLTVFVLGTVSRWRAVRAARRRKAHASPDEPGRPTTGARPDARVGPYDDTVGRPGDIEEPATAVPAQATAPQELPQNQPASQSTTAQAASPLVAPAPAETVPGARQPGRHGLHFAAPRNAAAEALRDAEGAAIVVTGDPALYPDTAGARAKLGPVHVYDPLHLTEAPTRLRWAPHQGCDDMDTARTRAAALLAPVRSPARSDSAVHAAAETLLRCWLHAAALTGEPFRQVHRWALAGSPKDAVRILRTDAQAASGSAGELEATLTAYPERREAATDLVRRALGCVSQLHVRNACTPSRIDRIVWESFVPEGGTLYVLGEPIEGPHRGDPAAMPLLTALTSAVVEHGRRMAVRSSSGRLDPPLTVVLDQPATVAPLPELPELLGEGDDLGITTYAFLRSKEQTRTWWPEIAGDSAL